MVVYVYIYDILMLLTFHCVLFHLLLVTRVAQHDQVVRRIKAYWLVISTHIQISRLEINFLKELMFVYFLTKAMRTFRRSQLSC